MRINYTHSGVRFRSGGKTYLFRHFNENENTIQWETTYTVYDGLWKEDQTIDHSVLLSLILDGPDLQSNGLYYCTPSAWADIESPGQPGFRVTHVSCL